MTKDEIKNLASKIKNGTATPQEELEFYKNINLLLEDMNKDLKDILKNKGED